MKRRFGILAAVVALGVGLLFVASVMFGRGGRGEFSPQTLQARTQREYLIPLTRIPIYRGAWSESRWPIVDYLVAKGYWSAADVAVARWVFSFQWNAQWHSGEAQYYKELVWHAEQWKKWTEDNPDLAKVMWPRLLSELRRTGARHVPGPDDILLGALIVKSPEEFNAMFKE